MKPELLIVAALLVSAGSAQAQDKDKGEAVYDLWCAPCHAAGPRKHPGTAALEVLYKGEKPAVLIERTDLTPELVTFYVRNGVSIMPFFRKTEISDQDLADLSAFLVKE
jgi:mono/diheme cytochrome c family protein